MGTGKGYGKTILVGDQFVLQGVPALLAAIPYETECSVEHREHGEGWTVEDNRKEVAGYKKAKESALSQSINTMLRIMKINIKETPLHINIGGNLLAGSGVGASAAVCVAFARACNNEFNLNLSNLEINYVAWKGEFAYHGLPSGLDNTVSTYGGTILYKIEQKKKMFERVHLKEPVEVVLANSGVTADTAALRGFLAEQKRQNAKLFQHRLEAVKNQVIELRKALEQHDLRKVGAVMNENHKLLIMMGLSHDHLIALCGKALEQGAYGAKVTGGGRGGFMLALTPGKLLQENVAHALEAVGAPVIRATIGNPPADATEYQLLK